MIERLESRTMLAGGAAGAFARLSDGVLRVNGTNGDDTIYVQTTFDEKLQVTRNGQSVFFDPAAVERLVVEAGRGNDIVSASYAHVPATLRGGKGNDTLAGSEWADLIDGGKGNDTLASGGGGDTLIGGPGRDLAKHDNQDRLRRVEQTEQLSFGTDPEGLMRFIDGPLTNIGFALARLLYLRMLDPSSMIEGVAIQDGKVALRIDADPSGATLIANLEQLGAQMVPPPPTPPGVPVQPILPAPLYCWLPITSLPALAQLPSVQQARSQPGLSVP